MCPDQRKPRASGYCCKWSVVCMWFFSPVAWQMLGNFRAKDALILFNSLEGLDTLMILTRNCAGQFPGEEMIQKHWLERAWGFWVDVWQDSWLMINNPWSVWNWNLDCKTYIVSIPIKFIKFPYCNVFQTCLGILLEASEPANRIANCYNLAKVGALTQIDDRIGILCISMCNVSKRTAFYTWSETWHFISNVQKSTCRLLFPSNNWLILLVAVEDFRRQL